MSVPLKLALAATAAGAVMVLGRPHTAASMPQQPAFQLAGTWTLDQNKTEQPREKSARDFGSLDTRSTDPRRAGRTRSGGSGGGRASGGATSGGAMRGGGRMGGRGGSGVFATMRPARSLKVTQTDSTIIIDAGGSQIPELLFLDGRTVADTQPDGIIWMRKATLKKDQLIVERKFDKDGNTKETYHLDKKNPKLLIIDYHLEQKQQGRTMDQKRVYDAAGGS